MYVDTKYGLGIVIKEFSDGMVLAFIDGHRYFLLVVNSDVRRSIAYNKYK